MPGERGERGERGKQGEQGVSGVYVGSGEMPEGYNVQVDPDGEAVVLFPELSIGTVETLPEGSDATATITGTAEHPTLNLGLPMGAQGEDGQRGIDGYTPYPGDNGNWFINGVDTGKPWQGEPGQDMTEKPWVLIESIALTEDVTQIVPNFPDNTYTELFVRGSFKYTRTDGKTTGTTSITIGNVAGDISFSRISNTGATNTPYYYMVEGYVAPDRLHTYEVFSSTGAYVGSTSAKNLYRNGITPYGDFLPPFSIYISTSGVYFASGSKFEIWGR